MTSTTAPTSSPLGAAAAGDAPTPEAATRNTVTHDDAALAAAAPLPVSPGSQTSGKAPGRPRNLWLATVIAMVLMNANYLVTVPAGIALAAVVPHNRPGILLTNIAGCLVTLATALVLVRFVARRYSHLTLADVGWRFTARSAPLFLVGWGLVTIGSLVAQVAPRVPGLVRRTQDYYPMTHDTAGAVAVVAVLAGIAQSVALQGIPEELVFRGWLMRTFADRPRTALVVGAVAFGALHLLTSGSNDGALEMVLNVVPPTCFAFLAGALVLRYHSLWAAVGVHAGMHLTNRILGYTSLRHVGGSVSVVEGLCWVVLGLVVLHGWEGGRVRFDS